MGVCASCIEDSALQKVVRDNLTECECEYCERSEENPIACELDVVTDYMRPFIEEEFCDPVEILPVEAGRYQGEYFDAWNLFTKIGFDVSSDELRRDLLSAFDYHDWCEKDYFGLPPGEAQIFGWKDFCKTVKGHRRYTFWSIRREAGEDVPTPAEMLLRLDEIIQVREYATFVETGTRFWRVQVLDENEVSEVPNRFTSPPTDKATVSNRMSPAGVSMFYAAAEKDTGYAEVVDPDKLAGKAVWGIQFEAAAPLTFLDLTQLPDPPSYFSERGYETANTIRFLQFFRRELAKPIERDGREHIDYVPTQVFTEYVRYEMRTFSGDPFHGIVYPSAKTGKPCYVIFAEQEHCLDGKRREWDEPQLLRAVPDSLTQCDETPKKAQ